MDIRRGSTVSVLGYLKGHSHSGIDFISLCGGGMDVFQNDPLHITFYKIYIVREISSGGGG